MGNYDVWKDKIGTIEYLEKYIDILFDDLKNKIATYAPRKDWLGGVKSWFSGQKRNPFEHTLALDLQAYSEGSQIIEELETQLNETPADSTNIINLIDSYKDRLKNFVRDFYSKHIPNQATHGEQPQAGVLGNTDNVRLQPLPGEKVTPPVPDEREKGLVPLDPNYTRRPRELRIGARNSMDFSQRESKPEKKARVAKPSVPTPELAAKPTAAPIPPLGSKPQVGEMDEDLIRKGWAIQHAKKLSGDDSISDEDIKHAIEAAKEVDLKVLSPQEIEMFKKTAIEYAKESVQKPFEQMTIEELKQQLGKMTGKELKAYMKNYDPDLFGAYADQSWSNKELRKSIIWSHLDTKQKKESTSKQRNLLKEGISLKYRSAKLSIPDKIKFYKENFKNQCSS